MGRWRGAAAARHLRPPHRPSPGLCALPSGRLPGAEARPLRRSVAAVLADHDRDDAHAMGRHHWCLPGDAVPLPDDDPHGLAEVHHDVPDACQWAARWRAPARALSATLPEDRPLGVVALDTVRGATALSSHASYRTAGPARTRVGRIVTDQGMGEAKGRCVVVCRLGHLH